MISCIITRLFTALPSFGFLSSSAFHLYFGLHPHSSITGAGVLDGYKGLWGELLIQVSYPTWLHSHCYINPSGNRTGGSPQDCNLIGAFIHAS